MSYWITFLTIPVVIFLNKYLIKKNILLNDTGNKHQKFSTIKKVPLIGGFFILLFILLLEFNISFKALALLTFSIGLFSDLNLLKSPKIRILLQSFFIFIFLFYVDIKLENLRIIFLENLLKNDLFNQLFLTFCIVVIINRTNFKNKSENVFPKDSAKVLSLPFSGRHLYGFIKSDKSWHYLKKLNIKKNEIRKSININLNSH